MGRTSHHAGLLIIMRVRESLWQGDAKDVLHQLLELLERSDILGV